MKKLLLGIVLFFFAQQIAFASDCKIVPKKSIPVKIIKIPSKEIDKCEKPITKYLVTEYVLTCGQSVLYFPPSGESCTNLINALINLNNAICHTSIPPIGAIFCGGILF